METEGSTVQGHPRQLTLNRLRGAGGDHGAVLPFWDEIAAQWHYGAEPEVVPRKYALFLTPAGGGSSESPLETLTYLVIFGFLNLRELFKVTR